MKHAVAQTPFRSELYNTGQMLKLCQTIADKHRLIPGYTIDDLMQRLSDNEKVLLEVQRLLHCVDQTNKQAVQNREWSTHFYFILDQVLKVKTLMIKVDNGLPRIQHRYINGLPRIYDLAVEIISHTDAQLSCENLTEFIKTYQLVSNLQNIELKAVRAIVKLALIENLRRVAIRFGASKMHQHDANLWTNKIVAAGEKDADAVLNIIEGLFTSGPALKSVFIAELIQQLRVKEQMSAAVALTWIERRLKERGLDTDDVLQSIYKEQMADRVSMRNSISSLRVLDNINWQQFVVDCSIIEPILAADESGVYTKMDYHTKDTYRREVGRLAKQANVSEAEVAHLAVSLSRNGVPGTNADYPHTHVGHYIIGAGRRDMERSLGIRLFKKFKWRESIARRPLLSYLGTMTVIAFLVLVYLLPRLFNETLPVAWSVLLSVFAFICVSYIAKYTVDIIAGLVNKPALMPRLDFSRGIPPEFRTLIVVPSLLTGDEEINDLVRSLEVRYLANRAENLHFALLTDFSDAHSCNVPGDERLLQQVKRQIEALNIKYKSGKQEIFFLFHRPRKYNKREKLWMGYERKRGKLMELNACLRGMGTENFSAIVGNHELFPAIKYVITLDADTQLPRETAWKMVATLAHPLNRAVYCEKKGRVISGYGILQPHVRMDMREADNSLYQRLNGMGPDIDPYTRATPDIYQDLFGEGSYIGKGIYDVDIAIKALHKRLPENRVLSHDLLEGCYVRSGILNDIKLYEKPSNLVTDIKRRHRWIRGDWQILPWVLPWVPGFNGRHEKNPLSALSRWKIFDNLRKSLVPVSCLILFMAGLTVLKDHLFWSLIVLWITFFPAFAIFSTKLLRLPRRLLSWSHWKNAGSETKVRLLLHLHDISCLPYEAFYTVDAILRAGWRTVVSRKKLLEWEPSGSLKNNRSPGMASFYLIMWVSPLAAAILGLYLTLYPSPGLILAWPLLAVWTVSPLIAWQMSRPGIVKAKLTVEHGKILRRLARKTWAYFEDFVNAGSNWLPPDHYQQYPKGKVADYTSPTNMGLALLANLAAGDFGYITAGTFIEYSGNTLNAMERLERYKGHFYNWYNIRSLTPTVNRYVSTVDSGNLIGHLLTFRQGVLAIPGAPVINPGIIKGMADTFAIISGSAGQSHLSATFLKEVPAILNAGPRTLVEIKNSVHHIKMLTTALIAAWPLEPGSDTLYWLKALERQCNDVMNELKILASWLWLAPAPEKYASLLPQHIPTLHELANAAIFKPGPPITDNENEWLLAFMECMIQAKKRARHRINELDRIARQCAGFADAQYDFLYKPSGFLLSIGFNVDTGCQDTDSYDVLASEARLGTYVAISQDKLPVKCWFSTGRTVVNSGRHFTLLSANGTMFEYLMPLLVMPAFGNTLLDTGCKMAVQKQIEHGKKHNIPWGVSESAYSAVDEAFNYQYKVFGIPELSLKREHSSSDKVIAPYATALALTTTPQEACINIERLCNEGFEGRYGFFESVDYTPSRMPRGESKTIVRSYMVHHQGMCFLSFAYLLLDKIMQKRFMADPQLESSVLVLQERIPKDNAICLKDDGRENVAAVHDRKSDAIPDQKLRNIPVTRSELPEAQLLSNSRYHVIVTGSGNGYSRWNNIAVTGWQKNNAGGPLCVVHDLEKNIFLSTTDCRPYNNHCTYETGFATCSAEFHMNGDELSAITKLVVSSEEDMEIRRITIHNKTNKRKHIGIISRIEVIMASVYKDNTDTRYDEASVRREILQEQKAVLYTRRLAGMEEESSCMFHRMLIHDKQSLSVNYNSDRLKTFVTKARSNAFSQGKKNGLEETAAAISCEIMLGPGETVTADICIGIAEDRDACCGLLRRTHTKRILDQLFELSYGYSKAILHQLNIAEEEVPLYRRLAGRVMLADDTFFQSDLLNSQDLFSKQPVVLVRIKQTAAIEAISRAVQMHAYWRLNGLFVTLIIWNEDQGCYSPFLQRLIIELISSGVGVDSLNHRHGGIYIKAVGTAPDEKDYSLLQTSSLVISAEKWILTGNPVDTQELTEEETMFA